MFWLKAARFVFDQKSFLIDSDTSTAIRYFGTDNNILISRYIKIFGQSCFSGCFDKQNKLGAVRFEAGSNLAMIGWSCFADCILQTIYIPWPVDIIGKSCFMNYDIETMIFEVESSLTWLDPSCSANCSIGSICVLCSINPLGLSCFFNSMMRKMIFKSQSRSEVVQPSCVENCRLERIEIPRTIEHLTQSRFSNLTIATFIFDSISQLHTIGDSCFLKWTLHHMTLHDITMRYITLQHLCIPCSVEMVWWKLFIHFA
jgi:hypothetical protein